MDSRKRLYRGKRRFPNGKRQIPPEAIPTAEPIIWNDFTGGYDSSMPRELVPENSTPYSLDMEVTKRGRLARAPGAALDEVLVNPTDQMALHASLDFRSELVLFSPPYLGIKSDAGVEWIDLSIPAADRFAWTVFGGTLLFSNRYEEAWARQPREDTIEVVEEMPPATSYASFAGRVVAGGAIIEGNLEPLGVRWSAANSDYRDWSGLGSGFELLIDEMFAGDRIMAMRTMGLDFMAIVCRRSIWLGRRTGLVNRPIDFQPRVPGVGAAVADTVVTSRYGVIFLSDNGVYSFDGNQAQHISKPIDADLLPLDTTQLFSYSGYFNPINKRYYLFTPTGTWVYDIEYKRWYRRSMIAKFGSLFAEQIPGKTWGELVGSWGAQTERWFEYAGRETDNIKMYFLGEQGASDILAHEDQATTASFGLASSPQWELPIKRRGSLALLETIQRVSLDYDVGGTAGVELLDNESQFIAAISRVLPATSTPALAQMTLSEHTGRGVSAKLTIEAGQPEVLAIQLDTLGRSERIIQ